MIGLVFAALMVQTMDRCVEKKRRKRARKQIGFKQKAVNQNNQIYTYLISFSALSLSLEIPLKFYYAFYCNHNLSRLGWTAEGDRK